LTRSLSALYPVRERNAHRWLHVFASSTLPALANTKNEFLLGAYKIVANARRQRIEEAVKADCAGCRAGDRPVTRASMNGLWHVGFDRASMWSECKATGARRLLDEGDA
jgi:hypothetical protein